MIILGLFQFGQSGAPLLATKKPVLRRGTVSLLSLRLLVMLLAAVIANSADAVA